MEIIPVWNLIVYLAIINRKQNYFFDILYLSKHIKLFYIIYFNEDNSYKILKYKHTYKKNEKEYICILTRKTIKKKIKMFQNNPQVITKNLNKFFRYTIIDKHTPCT